MYFENWTTFEETNLRIMNISNLTERKSKLAVIGMGYVGLPLALEFAKHVPVVGFDINEKRIDSLNRRIDPSNELDAASFEGCDIHFTCREQELEQASVFIIGVPTPVNKYNHPDLAALLSATRTVAGSIKKGDYVIYESTVYPGTTEEECIPLIEEVSGLKFGTDFKVGYSPERINPGDKEHTLANTVKIVSGCDEESLENIAALYCLVVKAGVHRASSIKVAEAAKIIENTQRDVNIALMNELSILFGRMGINTYDVLEAAGTKWNFLRFYPGLVGGHCIGVDPYYLVHKARELKYHPQMINSGRFVNDSMGGYIGKQVVKKLIAGKTNPVGAKVLVMGVTFKENVSDVRNSKVFDIIRELNDYGVDVEACDPHASEKDVKEEYGIQLVELPFAQNGQKYHAVVVAVSHREYLYYTETDFLRICTLPSLLVDIKGIYRGKIKTMAYWSL
ncbi:MAG: nucleotide sugar dehydrogenase [Prolixibacteraceae bacterium]|nr:nucleotide sugar dehydrogenase [Prolixibacteraceae bacterium]